MTSQHEQNNHPQIVNRNNKIILTSIWLLEPEYYFIRVINQQSHHNHPINPEGSGCHIVNFLISRVVVVHQHTIQHDREYKEDVHIVDEVRYGFNDIFYVEYADAIVVQLIINQYVEEIQKDGDDILTHSGSQSEVHGNIENRGT